jgi:hypothetical protein
MIKIMTAAALAMLAAGSVAAAQEAPRIAADLTRVEAQARASAMFDKLDLNHDGKLDQADRDLRVQRRFDAIDTDHSGQISREEFAAGRERGPHPVGPDGPPPFADGKPGPAWHGGPRGAAQGHGPGVGGPMGHMGGPDHDGVIARDAFVAGELKRFDAADADHNGTLTPAERQAAHKAMHDNWQARRQTGRGGKPDDMPPPPPPPASAN